jgi:hypothetical protein
VVSGTPPSNQPASAVPDSEALSEHVREVLAELDGEELAAHPEVFEGLSAAILDELRSLEGL